MSSALSLKYQAWIFYNNPWTKWHKRMQISPAFQQYIHIAGEDIQATSLYTMHNQ